MSLVGYTFIRNAFTYDYPVAESIMSMLPVVDKYIVCECFSEDNTWAEMLRLSREYPKIQPVRHPWGDHFSIQQRICNYILGLIPNGDWYFKLDADEIMHEDSWELFQSLPRVCQEIGAIGARFHYTHFVGNYETEFDFMYRRVRRFVQQGHGWQWDGDACQLCDGAGSFVDVDVEIHHYGKVHPPEVALKKETAFQQLYMDIGFPDPSLKVCADELGKLDYYWLFREACKRGEFRKFEGTHPAVMKERIEKFKKEGWEQFAPILDLDKSPGDYG